MAEPMYSYQRKAVDRIAKGDQVYLGFDPGLGKSRAALQAAMDRKARRILVICPASGRYVWEEQTKLWSSYKVTIVRSIGDLKGDGVFVLTYGLVSQKDGVYAAVVAKGAKFDMTVLDEAAAVKNPGSNRTKAILVTMMPNLGYVLPLSGTPAPNHAGELYPILKALYPAAIQGSNGHPLLQWQFEDRYCKVVSKRFGSGHPVRVIEGSRNTLELRERIAPFMIRVKKEDVLKDLPPVRYDVVPLGIDSNVASKLPIPANVGLDDDNLMQYLAGKVGEEHLMRLRRMLGLAKIAPAIEYIDDFLNNLSHLRKVLVFAHHRDVIEQLLHGLSNHHPVKIDGSTSTQGRAAAVDMFLTDSRCRLFIGNIAASGTGLTLVGPKCACSDVIFVEASYSVGDNVQAAARVHRIGQREGVVARFLTAHGTIDDRINDILARKARDFANLFE